MLFLSFFLLLCQVLAQKWIGCYVDSFRDRDLKDLLFLNDVHMTPDYCLEKCGEHGYKYYGVQYGEECWCGNTYGKHEKVPDTECWMKCKGDERQKCGGDSRNAIYERTKEVQLLPEKTDKRPLLALVMMVKDEGHTLPNTLLCLKPYIDYYYILDTFSTDNTQETIRQTLGLNGMIHQEAFVDYGASRNRALKLAADAPNPPYFSLMLSADETVYNAADLREYLEENKHRSGDGHDAYAVTMDSGTRFLSTRVTRPEKGWRYVGRVHEYVSAPDDRYHSSGKIPHVWIRFKATDLSRRMERQYMIVRILEEEKAIKPGDSRTAFYLAMEYDIIGNHTASLLEYRRRIALGGWKEEVYDSMFQVGWQLKALNYSWADVQQAWIDSHLYSQDRAEPLFWIAQHYQTLKQYTMSYAFARRCFEIPYPSHVQLWVTKDIYEWRCAYILGHAGLQLRLYDDAIRGFARAYKALPKDWDIFGFIANIAPSVSARVWYELYPLDDPVQPPPGDPENGARKPVVIPPPLPAPLVAKPELESSPTEDIIVRNPNTPVTPTPVTTPVTHTTTPTTTPTTTTTITNNEEGELREGGVAWFTIFLNVCIVGIFIGGFISFARARKLE